MQFLKNPLVIITLVLVAGGIGITTLVQKDKGLGFEIAIVEKRNLVQEVSITGRVQSAQVVDLAFESGGKIASVQARIGDRVQQGSVLVLLDTTELLASLAEATASVQAKEAVLQELQRGTRAEEIAIQQVKIQNAQTSLQDTKQQAVDTLQDSYTRSDDAIRNKVDQVFSSPTGASPQLLFTTTHNQLEISVKSRRSAIEQILTRWKLSLQTLSVQSDLDSVLIQGKQDSAQIKAFLDDIALLINGAASSSVVSQTTLNSWKADVSTARTNVNTVGSNISGVQEALRSALSVLALEQQNLVLQQAGSSQEELAAQAATVDQAKATENKIQAQLAKSTLRSPIAGVVTKQQAKIGELVTAGTVLVSLISDNNFEIEARVPEVDIAKIQVGNKARVTLDAYGRDEVFVVSVVTIDPAETIVEGIATYTVTLLFDKEDERVRSGMTANIDIVTDQREDVFAVPQRAVVQEGERKFVRILQGEEVKDVDVQIGLRGSDGYIEIVEGLQQGDTVITFIPD